MKHRRRGGGKTKLNKTEKKQKITRTHLNTSRQPHQQHDDGGETLHHLDEREAEGGFVHRVTHEGAERVAQPDGEDGCRVRLPCLLCRSKLPAQANQSAQQRAGKPAAVANVRESGISDSSREGFHVCSSTDKDVFDVLFERWFHDVRDGRRRVKSPEKKQTSEDGGLDMSRSILFFVFEWGARTRAG